MDEDSRPDPPDAYTSSKLAGERIFSRAAGKDKHLWILRVNAPYGPGMPDHAVVCKFLQLARQGRPLPVWGDGSREQHFTWVGDFCRAVEMLPKTAAGVYHLVGPDRLSMEQLARLCMEVCGSASGLERIPGEAGLSAPVFGPDRLEPHWPRSRRTGMRRGLKAMLKATGKA